ncbi:MAG: peptidyl-prolyl cis-trans isomerase [Planctomycetota bacterium]
MKQIVAVLVFVVAVFVAITIALQQTSESKDAGKTSSAAGTGQKAAKPGSEPPANEGSLGKSSPPAGGAAARDRSPEKATPSNETQSAASTEPGGEPTAASEAARAAGIPDPADEVPELGHDENSTFEVDDRLAAIYQPTEEELAEIEQAKKDVQLVITDGEHRHEISRFDFENTLIEIYGNQLFQKNVLASIARSERAAMTSEEARQRARISDQEIAARMEYHKDKFAQEQAANPQAAGESFEEVMSKVLGSNSALLETIWAQTALEKMLLPKKTADLPAKSLEWLAKLQPDVVEKIRRGELLELPAASRQFLLQMLLSERRIKAEFRYAREGDMPDGAFATIDGQPIPRQPLLREVQKLLESQNELKFIESYFVTNAILSDYLEDEALLIDPEEFQQIWEDHARQYDNSMIPLSAFVTMFMGFPNNSMYKDWFQVNQSLIREVKDEVDEETLRGYYQEHQRDLELGKIALQGIFLLATEGDEPYAQAKERAEAVAKILDEKKAQRAEKVAQKIEEMKAKAAEQGNTDFTVDEVAVAQQLENQDFIELINEYSESKNPTKGNFGKSEHKNEWMKLLSENLFYVYFCGHETMSERLMDMKKGDISEPIRFSQGYAILRVADEQLPGNPRGFEVEAIRDRVQASIADEKFKQVVYDGLGKYRVEKP